MRKPVVIGDKTYQFKKDAILHYRTILNSYEFGQSLKEDDFIDLIDLLSIEDDNIKNTESDLNNENIKETFAFDKKNFSSYQMDPLGDEGNRYINN